MKFSFSKILALLFCSFALHLNAEITDPSTKVTFPDTVTFNYAGKVYNLKATGVATRKKLIVSVYSVAHYLQEGANGGDKFQQIMNANLAKQLTLKWVHEASADKIRTGYEDSFKNSLGQDFSRFQNEINQFIGFFSNGVQKGDEQILRWLPDGTIEVYVNGDKVGNIQNKDFARGLWGIWFGPNSVVNKDKLTSLMK